MKIGAKCPFCTHEYSNELSDAMQICIPIIGGARSGKTTLVNSGINEIKNFAAEKENKVVFEYYSPDDRARHESTIRQMSYGNQNKTAEKWDSYKIYISEKKAKVKERVYIYDVGGEIYDSGKAQSIEKKKVFEYTKSLLFVVDPLAIEDVRDEFEARYTGNKSYAISDRNVNDIVTNTLNSLQQFDLSKKAMQKINVAVVITKSDVPMIAEQIGEEAVNKVMADEKVNRLEAQNIVCGKFMRKYNCTNFLGLLEGQFGGYQFFASAYCSDANQNEKVYRTADPFLWLIDMETPRLSFSKRWRK